MAHNASNFFSILNDVIFFSFLYFMYGLVSTKNENRYINDCHFFRNISLRFDGIDDYKRVPKCSSEMGEKVRKVVPQSHPYNPIWRRQ